MIAAIAAMAAALPLLLSTNAVAEPAVVAKLDDQQVGARMAGELRFDLGGGPLSGQITVAARGDGALRYQNGSTAKGLLTVRVDFNGMYGGGLFGQFRGTANVSGTFVSDTNCKAPLTGQGIFNGNASGPLGLTIAMVEWSTISIDGCDLVPTQAIALALPPFRFAKTEDVTMTPGVRLPPPVGSRGPPL